MNLKMKRYLLGLLLILGGSLAALAQSSGDGYNPDNPNEPGDPGTLVKYTVAVKLGTEGAGTVTGTGVYKYGTNVTVKTTTNSGYKFLYWQKNDELTPYNTNAQFTYTVDKEDVTFTAIHEKQKTISVNMNNSLAGTVTGGGKYFKNDVVTLKATTNKCFNFLYWKKGDSDSPYSTDATCTYTVEDEDVNFEAVYDCPPSVTALSNDVTGGTVSWSYDVVNGNNVARLKATPASKYRLMHWLRNDETEPYSEELTFDYQLTDEDVTFTAVFRWNPDNPSEPSDIEKITKHEVKVSVNEEAAGIVSGAGSYLYNKVVTISTSANAGYRFLHWLKDDDETPYKTTTSFSYTMGVEDVSFVAVYEEIPPVVVPDSHKLFLVPSTQGCCTFSMASGTSIVEGESFSVTVTPGPEQRFDGWYQNGVLVAETRTYGSYMGTEDITLEARCTYVPESPDEPNNPGGFIPEVEEPGVLGDVNGDGKVTVADAVAIIDYYLHWTEASEEDQKYDVNKDSKVTVADAVEAINIYLNAN